MNEQVDRTALVGENATPEKCNSQQLEFSSLDLWLLAPAATTATPETQRCKQPATPLLGDRLLPLSPSIPLLDAKPATSGVALPASPASDLLSFATPTTSPLPVRLAVPPAATSIFSPTPVAAPRVGSDQQAIEARNLLLGFGQQLERCAAMEDERLQDQLRSQAEEHSAQVEQLEAQHRAALQQLAQQNELAVAELQARTAQLQASNDARQQQLDAQAEDVLALRQLLAHAEQQDYRQQCMAMAAQQQQLQDQLHALLAFYDDAGRLFDLHDAVADRLSGNVQLVERLSQSQADRQSQHDAQQRELDAARSDNSALQRRCADAEQHSAALAEQVAALEQALQLHAAQSAEQVAALQQALDAHSRQSAEQVAALDETLQAQRRQSADEQVQAAEQIAALEQALQVQREQAAEQVAALDEALQVQSRQSADEVAALQRLVEQSAEQIAALEQALRAQTEQSDAALRAQQEQSAAALEQALQMQADAAAAQHATIVQQLDADTRHAAEQHAAELAAVHGALAHCQQQHSDVVAQLHSSNAAVERLEQLLAAAEQRAAESSADASAQRQCNAQLVAELDDSRAQCARAVDETLQLRQTLDQCSAQLAARVSELEATTTARQRLEEALARTAEQRDSAEQRSVAAHERLRDVDAALAHSRADSTRLADEQRQLAERLAQAERTCDALRDELTDSSAAAAQLTADVHSGSAALQRVQQQLADERQEAAARRAEAQRERQLLTEALSESIEHIEALVAGEQQRTQRCAELERLHDAALAQLKRYEYQCQLLELDRDILLEQQAVLLLSNGMPVHLCRELKHDRAASSMYSRSKPADDRHTLAQQCCARTLGFERKLARLQLELQRTQRELATLQQTHSAVRGELRLCKNRMLDQTAAFEKQLDQERRNVKSS